MIAIVDYGMGNLRSVQKAVERVGGKAVLTSSPRVIERAPAVILPGVGAFGEAMKRLRALRLIRPLQSLFVSGRAVKPFLGICLGLQLLYERSEEAPGVKGLGIFKGRVRRFRGPVFASRTLKVPHMGWNTVRPVTPHPWLRFLTGGERFYFVHSFYADPSDEQTSVLETAYGNPFCAAIGGPSFLAMQFHPEKSGNTGLTLLKHFVRGARC